MRRRARRAPGAATSVSSPLSTTTQSKRSAASCTDASRCAATPRLAAEQARELALVRGEHARRRPLARLELEQRVGVDDHRQLDLREQPPDERLRLRLAPEAGTDRERPGLRARPRRRPRAAASPPPARASRGPAATRPARRSSRSRRRRGGRPRRRGGAPVMPREPPTTRTWPGGVLVVAARAARHLGRGSPA